MESQAGKFNCWYKRVRCVEMKIFLTGASGMLAADVIPELKAMGHVIVETDAKPRLEHIQVLDITDAKQVDEKINAASADFVFHLAAKTNVDYCEQNPDNAFKVNTMGTENIVLACQKYDIPLLYVSTAGVFSGDKKEPYTEFDEPRPVNIYGESKLQGEHIVEKLLSKFFIIRGAWMMGGWEIDKKFVYKIVQQLKEGKTQLRVVSDKFGTPTFTKDFAKNLMNVINTKRYGLFHMTNKGTCTRYDIAKKIVKLMGLENTVSVEAISSGEFPLPAPRPDSEMIHNYKLELLGLNNMPKWEDSLTDYIMKNKDKVECFS